MAKEQKKSHDVAAILWLVFCFPLGLLVMWGGTTWHKNVKWGITGAFLVCILLGAILSKTDSKSASTPTTVASAQVTTLPTQEPTAVPTTPTPTPTPIPKDANGFPMDYQAVTVAQIAKVPSAYNGKIVMFDCTVSNFVKGDNGDAAGFNCSDPNDYGSLLQVDSGKLFDYTQINEGDTVRIYGLGSGSSSGQNAYGGNVTEAVVGGVFINDLTSGYKN